MSENVFPSGPWVGFYNYGAATGRHEMELSLAFARGVLTGEGRDDIGLFHIRGRYDAVERECWWVKTYPGLHEVHYRGFREGRGIWGTWEIGSLARGGFHIWPRAEGTGATESRAATEPEPVQAVATQTATGTPIELRRVCGCWKSPKHKVQPERRSRIRAKPPRRQGITS